MDERKHRIYLSLGSNLGDRKQSIEDALDLLERNLGRILLKSSYYVTEGWGQRNLNEFYNLTVAFETEVSVQAALEITQETERALGRRNKTSNREYANRAIDIDILFFDNLMLETKTLIIPHPLLHQRRFVLMPLNETSASLLHPKLKKTVAQLLVSVDDESECKKMLN